jgi:hypothetical protein
MRPVRGSSRRVALDDRIWVRGSSIARQIRSVVSRGDLTIRLHPCHTNACDPERRVSTTVPMSLVTFAIATMVSIRSLSKSGLDSTWRRQRYSAAARVVGHFENPSPSVRGSTAAHCGNIVRIDPTRISCEDPPMREQHCRHVDRVAAEFCTDHLARLLLSPCEHRSKSSVVSSTSSRTPATIALGEHCPIAGS